MKNENKLPIQIELPEGFLEEEVRCDYNVNHEMKAVWAVELDLLMEFARVCRKYDIKWYADGGTLLGAVRHNGYIPWDDDIDVVVMRKEYERLCSVATDEFKEPYFFQTEYNDPSSLRGHAQLRNSKTTGILKSELLGLHNFNQGIFIDIFPLDSVPDDEKKLYKKIKGSSRNLFIAKKIAAITDRYNVSPERNKYKDYLYKMLFYFFSKRPFKSLVDYDFFYRKYEKYCKLYNDNESNKIAKYFCNPVEKRQIWLKKDFASSLNCKFEFISIPIPNGYEHVLSTFFGDDWQTPKRGNTIHSGVIFDTKMSYLDYKRGIQ